MSPPPPSLHTHRPISHTLISPAPCTNSLDQGTPTDAPPSTFLHLTTCNTSSDAGGPSPGVGRRVTASRHRAARRAAAFTARQPAARCTIPAQRRRRRRRRQRPRLARAAARPRTKRRCVAGDAAASPRLSRLSGSVRGLPARGTYGASGPPIGAALTIVVPPGRNTIATKPVNPPRPSTT